jgi:DNA-binding NarL/FixJ family response regulator
MLKKTIVIVEDNQALRTAFEIILESLNKYFVYGYSSCEEAIDRLDKDNPDLIIMDIELPGISGIEGIERIKRSHPDVTILVNSIHENSDLVFKALCNGASGYITKSSSPLQLVRAIEEVENGGAPMSMKIAKMVVSSFKKNLDSPLSVRETSVLELLAKGKSYSAIGEELFITKETAKSHIKNIYAKLQVNCKADAIAIATVKKFI